VLRKKRERQYCHQPDLFLAFLPLSSSEHGAFCHCAGAPAAAGFVGLAPRTWYLCSATAFFRGEKGKKCFGLLHSFSRY